MLNNVLIIDRNKFDNLTPYDDDGTKLQYSLTKHLNLIAVRESEDSFTLIKARFPLPNNWSGRTFSKYEFEIILEAYKE